MLSITQLNEEDRPREKFLLTHGNGMTKAELLAILIGSGSTDENAVQLMQRILTDCNGQITTLGKRSVEELCQYKGVGPAKAVTILAACLLGDRRAEEQVRPEAIVTSEDIYRYYHSSLRNLSHEESHVLLLNQNLKVVASRLVSRGGITGTVVDVRRVLREALLVNATQIALVHNHPSGSLRPSREDDRLTEKLKQAANTMDIRMVDHVIVTNDGYYSYQDEGRI